MTKNEMNKIQIQLKAILKVISFKFRLISRYWQWTSWNSHWVHTIDWVHPCELTEIHYLTLVFWCWQWLLSGDITICIYLPGKEDSNEKLWHHHMHALENLWCHQTQIILKRPIQSLQDINTRIRRLPTLRAWGQVCWGTIGAVRREIEIILALEKSEGRYCSNVVRFTQFCWFIDPPTHIHTSTCSSFDTNWIIFGPLFTCCKIRDIFGKYAKIHKIFSHPASNLHVPPIYVDETVPMTSGTEDKWLSTRPLSANEFCDTTALIKMPANIPISWDLSQIFPWYLQQWKLKLYSLSPPDDPITLQVTWPHGTWRVKTQ